MTVTIEGVPESIERQAFIDWLAQVGIDAEMVRSITIDRRGIRAEVFARNEKGKKVARGGERSVHTVHIRINNDWAGA